MHTKKYNSTEHFKHLTFIGLMKVLITDNIYIHSYKKNTAWKWNESHTNE